MISAGKPPFEGYYWPFKDFISGNNRPIGKETLAQCTRIESAVHREK